MKVLRYPILVVAGLCCLLALSVQAAEKDLTVPDEVGALTDRAAACHRWSGTEITDQSDDALVEGELASLKCGSLAADAEKLQRKYAGSESALKAIAAVRALGF
jgi:hypothetical protein